MHADRLQVAGDLLHRAVSEPGDSGAPFYVYSVDGANVFIRGMAVASGVTTSFAEKWSRISSNLGVSIVT